VKEAHWRSGINVRFEPLGPRVLVKDRDI
jgi:hypothetical protein